MCIEIIHLRHVTHMWIPEMKERNFKLLCSKDFLVYIVAQLFFISFPFSHKNLKDSLSFQIHKSKSLQNMIEIHTAHILVCFSEWRNLLVKWLLAAFWYRLCIFHCQYLLSVNNVDTHRFAMSHQLLQIGKPLCTILSSSLPITRKSAESRTKYWGNFRHP